MVETRIVQGSTWFDMAASGSNHGYFLRSKVIKSTVLDLPSNNTSVKLVELPNEVLVQILSHLDARTVLHLRTLCYRLWVLASDPIIWSTILWRSSNHVDDADGLKLALKLSKGVLKELRHDYCNCLYKCIDCVASCCSLESVSLVSGASSVCYTEKEMLKLLGLPCLTYLHVENITAPLFEVIIANGRQLKTLSVDVLSHWLNLHELGKLWSNAGYLPPDLRVLWPDDCDIDLILSLPPSLSHDAYLTSYHVRKKLQFWFNPHPSMPTLARFERISLAADTPGSINFSEASCVEFHRSLLWESCSKNKFSDVYHSLKALYISLYRCPISNKLFEMSTLLPNLIHLDLGNSLLTDLKGLAAVSRCCLQLSVLKLLCTFWKIESFETELWSILARMRNLKVLSMDSSLIVDPVTMPGLTAIDIAGGGAGNEQFVLGFLKQMPFLQILCFEVQYCDKVCMDFSNVLHSNLTHICDCLLLPTIPSCYANLEELYLCDEAFVFREDLARALAPAKNLCSLELDVYSCDVRALTTLVNSSKSLSVLHVALKSEVGFGSCYTANPEGRMALFEKSLIRIAKCKGRLIDVKIGSNAYVDFDIYTCTWFPLYSRNRRHTGCS